MNIGLQVNQGAARQTRAFADSLLGAEATPAPAGAGTGPKCC